MLALLDHTLACRLSFLVEIDEKEKTCQRYPYHAVHWNGCRSPASGQHTWSCHLLLQNLCSPVISRVMCTTLSLASWSL